MARRSGLGKGLGSLIPTTPADAAAPIDPGAFRELPIASITPNRHQPRAHFDEESLVALTASVREVGVIQPVLVRPSGDGSYELIAGERRWRRREESRTRDHPVVGPRSRRAGGCRAGPRREPPPRGPQPARGGGRLPTADRRLRPDPRRAGDPGGPQPGRDHEHVAPLPAAAEHSAPRRRGPHLRGPCPRAARHSGPRFPGGARQARRRRGPLGAGSRGGGARSPRRSRAGPERPEAAPAARLGCSNSRSCSQSGSTLGSRSTWALDGARSSSSSPRSRTSSGSTDS